MPAMGDRDESGLLHAFVLDGAGGGEELDWAGVDAWIPDRGILWIHLDYAGAEAKTWLVMRSGLDAIVRDALLENDPRPRALPHDGERLFLIVRGVNQSAEGEPEDLVSLRCWLEPRRIVTLRHRTAKIVKPIVAALAAGKGPRTVGDFLTVAIERVIEPVVKLVDRIDDDVARVEHDVLGEHDDRLRAQLAELRRDAIALRRFVGPQRDALAKLPALDVAWLGEAHRARLREAADRLTRTVEELDAARDRAAVTNEELQGRQGELTNKRLYVLSIMTAVFLPLGFVTGMLGVNVGGVPAKDVESAFWVLLGILSTAVVIQLWLFKRRGWF
jgi:zinc transporter